MFRSKAAITWVELAEYPEHPKRDEFVRYLAWKGSFLAQKRRALPA
jgi:hypothetical protein